jgi:hypothetical protein
MSDANLTVLLADEKAYWVDSTHAGLLPDEVVVREWRNLPLQSRIEAVAALKARRTETAPKAQTKAYPGLWRIQKIEDIVVRDKQGGTESLTIRETLAFGLATTLVGETPNLIDEIEIPSTVKNHAASPAHSTGTAPVEQNYKTLTLQWDSLDPQKLNSIMAERTALTETAITVGTESHTGPWYLLSRKPSWAEDGSGVYEEKWGLQEWKFEAYGKQGDMDVTATRHIQGVPKDRVKAALDAEITLMGAEYGKAGVSYNQKIYWREDTADIITEATADQAKSDTNTSLTQKSKSVVRLVYKNATTIPDADVAAQGVTVRLEGRITANGIFDYEKETTTAVKQEVTQFDSEVSAAKTEKTKSGDNLYDADIAGYAITQTDGKVLKRSHIKNDDGTFRDVVQEVVSINQTASTDGTHSDQHLDADDRTEDTERYTAASAPLADVAFSTQGTIVETENAPNEDGTFRTEKKTVVSKEQEVLATVVGEDKFKQVKADYGKQIKDTNLAAHFPVAATTGEIQTRRISENADGTFDVTRERDIAQTVASATVTSEIKAFETIAVDVDRNNTAGDTPPASQTAGIIKRVTNKVNEYNRVDVEVETRTATDVTTAEQQTEVRAFDKTESLTDRNQDTIATPQTSQTAGTIISAKGTLNEFGKYDNIIVTKRSVPVADVEKSKTISLFETNTEVTDKHQILAVTEETTQTPGKVVMTRFQKDEFGRFTNTTVTKDSTNIEAARKETRATAFEVVSSVTDKNDAAVESPILSHTPGTIKTVTAVKNEFGEYDNTLETRTATADVTSEGNKVAAGDSVLTSSTVNNVASPASAPTFTAGQIDTQRKRLNEFGRWDVETTTDLRQDQSISSGNVVKTPRYTSAIAVVDGASIAPSALGEDEYGRVSYRKDKYGRYVGEKEVTTYNDTITIPGWALTSTKYDVKHIIRTTYQGKGYMRDLNYTVDVLQTNSANAAISHITGGLTSTEAGSSRYEPLGNGQYRAIKITAGTIASPSTVSTTWTADTGGNFP